MFTLKRASYLLCLLSCNAFATGWTTNAFPCGKVTPYVGVCTAIVDKVVFTYELDAGTNSIPSFAVPYVYGSSYFHGSIRGDVIGSTNTSMTFVRETVRSITYYDGQDYSATSETTNITFAVTNNETVIDVDIDAVWTVSLETIDTTSPQQRLIDYYRAAKERVITYKSLYGREYGVPGVPIPELQDEQYRDSIGDMKNWIASACESYLNTSLTGTNASFEDWIESHITNTPPCWDTASLLSYVGAPENYFGSTARLDTSGNPTGYSYGQDHKYTWSWDSSTPYYSGVPYSGITTTLVYTITATNWNNPTNILPEQYCYDATGKSVPVIGTSGDVFRIITTNARAIVSERYLDEEGTWVYFDNPQTNFYDVIPHGYTYEDYGEKWIPALLNEFKAIQLHNALNTSYGGEMIKTMGSYTIPDGANSCWHSSVGYLEPDVRWEIVDDLDSHLKSVVNDYLAIYPYTINETQTIETIALPPSIWNNDRVLVHAESEASGVDLIITGLLYFELPETTPISHPCYIGYVDGTIEYYSRVTEEAPFDYTECILHWYFDQSFTAMPNLYGQLGHHASEGGFFLKKSASTSWNEDAKVFVATGINSVTDTGFSYPSTSSFQYGSEPFYGRWNMASLPLECSGSYDPHDKADSQQKLNAWVTQFSTHEGVCDLYAHGEIGLVMSARYDQITIAYPEFEYTTSLETTP